MKQLIAIFLLAISAQVFALDGFQLQTEAQVGGVGVFLDEILSSTNAVAPHVRIAAAPRAGQTLTLSRKQVEAALVRTSDSAFTNCLGADQVRVTRRVRSLDEEALKVLLTTQFQTDFIKDRGDLELRLARVWNEVMVPDEPLTLKIIEMPANGVAPLFVCRFELVTTNETVGTWQVSLIAKVWREVWASRTALRRGALLADADLTRERRDVLMLREPLAEFDVADPGIEIAEYVGANVPLLARSLKTKPAMRRGQSAQAMVLDGVLAISMKVEVLEDGVPGQVIRIRNPQTRRELRGKVQNDQTIVVSL
ncbi:MAG TPA: flagellar basal body P-ring formation chaperone FlgA [Candidatus Acidoferrum sp.]|nr:flagellar basal body P-ring formation chaperone FlgA [Candidatus Acidoferrum sp.]